MPRLLLATPEGQQSVDLRAHNSLGRHPSNSIQLLDKIVSKEHCTIEQRGTEFVLRDLGSLNGTYINGERVAGERLLRHGDDIALGMTRARFDDGSGRALAPPTPVGAPIASVSPQSALGTQMPWQPSASPAVTGGHPAARPPLVTGPLEAARPQAPTSFQPAPAAVQSGTAALPITVPGQTPGVSIPSTRVAVSEQARQIGTQIAATQKFLPHQQIANNPAQLAADYERLRLSYELSREIALERDLPTLLNKILHNIFKFVRADRGVIFLKDNSSQLTAYASLRRDGTDAPISVSSTIMSHVIRERATVLTHDAAMDFAASKGKSMILNRISSAIVAPLVHDDEILGVLWLDSETLAQFQPKDLELVTAIAAQAAMFIEISILAKKIEQEIVHRERFRRLLSPNLAERVISGELEVKKGGQFVAECTVFNSDIRGFTAMSEGAPPESIVEMLNEYFEQMVETIFAFEGTLDKFMGDGIMAVWGAPVVHPDDAVRAVRCAIEQMILLGRFNRKRIEQGLRPLAIGIGVHSGPVVAGYIGSSKSLSYTVIGDTANTSARLCGVATAGQILVSESTLGWLRGGFEYEELAPVQLRGKEKPVRVFNIRGSRPSLQVPAAVPSVGS
ncbi:adenylate/guanylate cyclase domain-containing protein [Myxococcota bacterium]